MNRLQRLHDECGQSPWLDNLKRGYLTGGQLVHLRDTGIRGLTSNPTIFQKAIQGSPDYDEQFTSLIRESDQMLDSYWGMVTADIRGALDVMAPVHEESGGVDGYVSIEVAPDLARDTQGPSRPPGSCTSASTGRTSW
jgi:transaldolase